MEQRKTSGTCADLLSRVCGQSSILLLLDFDGTLSEIVPRSEDAVLYPGNSGLLENLIRSPHYTVGILSGRSLEDVRYRVGIPGLVYAGNHGLEISGPGIQYVHPITDDASRAMAHAAHQLTMTLSGIPGAFVEDKTLSLTVHYRQTPHALHSRVADLFADATEPLVTNNLCRVTNAKAALELRPLIDWHKGRAFDFVRDHLAPTAFPIYIGDDATDEDAFRAAQSHAGAAVFVGQSGASTEANYRLDNPSAVNSFLSELAANALA